MNKLLIVLLAVCLVSVHAFVKRDAPAISDDMLAKIQKDVAGLGEQLQAAFDSEGIKKGFNEFVDNINKAIDSISAKKEANQ